MTPEERANRTVDEWLADQAIKHNGTSIRGPIAAAIRDAVTEAEHDAKEFGRVVAALDIGDSDQDPVDAVEELFRHCDSWKDRAEQALAALEPFARLAARFDNVNNPWFTWRDDNWLPWDAPLDRKFFTIGQLRAARDAYLALGGRLDIE